MSLEKIGSFLNSGWEVVVNSTGKAGTYIADTCAWKWLKDTSPLDTLQTTASTISDVALKLIRKNRIVVGVGMIGTGIICVAKAVGIDTPDQGRARAIYMVGGTALIASGFSNAVTGIAEAFQGSAV